MEQRHAHMLLEETELDLIHACRDGDADAFRELFERYKDKVYSIALRYAGDPATAQDIAQDTFIKLYSTIGSFRADAKFDSWLYRIVVNSCLDHRRRQRRLMPLLDRYFGILREPRSSALDEIMRDETSGAVQTAVANLKPEQRIVIVLRYTEGLSYEEIAEILGCSTGTIASRLSRVHKVLERKLSRLAVKTGARRA
jgi:RNA polymerase sigma-70 factor (ECF subfamily)